MDENVKVERNYWAVIPAPVFNDPDLAPAVKLLYALISTLTHETGYCYASNAYFMEFFDIDERTVQRHLKALKDGGHIQIVNGEGGTGRRKIYAGVNPLSDNPDKNAGVDDNPGKNAGGTPANLSSNPGKNVTRNNKENNKDYNTPSVPPGQRAGKKKREDWRPDLFDRFYSAYPRRQKRMEAIEAWNKLKPDEALMQVMISAIEKQRIAYDWTPERKRYIPLPASWLNGRRWEDELEISPPPPKREEDEEWL